MRFAPILWLMAMAAFTAACGSGGPKAVEVGASGDGDSSQLDDNSDDLISLPEADITGEIANRTDNAPIDWTYTARITVAGIKACDGEITLKVDFFTKDFSKFLQMPNSKLDCLLVGEMDLEKLMGGMMAPGGGGGGVPGGGISEIPLRIEDDMLQLTGLPLPTGKVKYIPARPVLPSILAADEDVLRKFNHTQKFSVLTASDGKSDSGSVNIKTIFFGGRYRTKNGGVRIDDAMGFKISHQGFKKVNRIFAGMITESMEVVIARDPMAIAKLKIVTPVYDLKDVMKQGIPGQQGGGGLGGLGGMGGMDQLLGPMAQGPLGQILLDTALKIIRVTLELEIKRYGGIDTDTDLSDEFDGELGNTSRDGDDDDDDDDEDEDDDED